MSELFTVDNGKMQIHLHPGQTKAWDSRARFTFVIAGTQSGKTSFEPFWLDREIREKGPGYYLAVTATYDLFKLKFLPEMTNYFCNYFGWGYSASDRVIWKNEGPQKTRIIMRSANAPGGLESTTAKAAVMDECGQDEFSLSAWEAIQRRLSLAHGRAFGGTTPYNLGWLKTQVFDRWQKGDSDYQVIQFKSTMNPAFPMDEYDRAKATLPAWKFEMFYNGAFSHPAGLIYEDFTPWHVCDPFPIPARWPRFLGTDFGAIHTAKIFVAMDPATGIFYIIDDPLDGNMTTQQHVESVKQNRFYQRGLVAWGGALSEKQQRWDWKADGLNVKEPPIHDVEAGLDRVTEFLRTRILRVFSTCVGTIDEFGRYARKLNDAGEPTEEIKDKALFHRLDGVRYVVSGLTKNIRAQSAKIDLYSVPQKIAKIKRVRSETEIDTMLQESNYE
jgi:hypothetical protein